MIAFHYRIDERRADSLLEAYTYRRDGFPLNHDERQLIQQIGEVFPKLRPRTQALLCATDSTVQGATSSEQSTGSQTPA